MHLTVFGIFIASFFLGEYATIPLFVLANQGYAELATVAFLVYTASLSADLFWYFVATIFFKNFDLDKWYRETHISNRKLYNFVLNKHLVFSVTFVKFLVGLRLILTLSLILIKKFSFLRYLGFSLLSNLFLIIGLYILGFSINSGLNLLPIYKGISGIVSVFIISVLLVKLVPYAIKVYYEK